MVASNHYSTYSCLMTLSNGRFYLLTRRVDHCHKTHKSHIFKRITRKFCSIFNLFITHRNNTKCLIRIAINLFIKQFGCITINSTYFSFSTFMADNLEGTFCYKYCFAVVGMGSGHIFLIRSKRNLINTWKLLNHSPIVNAGLTSSSYESTFSGVAQHIPAFIG